MQNARLNRTRRVTVGNGLDRSVHCCRRNKEPGGQALLTGELSPQVTEGFIKNAECRICNTQFTVGTVVPDGPAGNGPDRSEKI